MAAIAVTDTAQDALAANEGRQGLIISLASDQSDVWYNFGADAVAGESNLLEAAEKAVFDQPRIVSYTKRLSVVCSTGETATLQVTELY